MCLPGGFAYEDRIRAGAVAAYDAVMDPVIEGAQAGKLVLGICNGAQILAEAGLVPGTAGVRRPTAAFAPNASGRFSIGTRPCEARGRTGTRADPRGDRTRRRHPGLGLAWDGRLAAPANELERIVSDGHLAFVYADRDGNQVPAPNGAALDCAGL